MDRNEQKRESVKRDEREYKQIADRILAAMEAQQLSYGELAARTKIPKSALQRYATGGTEKIPLDRIRRIAAALGMSAAALMGWEDGRTQAGDSELIRLLMQLRPEEIPLVTAYLQALQDRRSQPNPENKKKQEP